MEKQAVNSTRPTTVSKFRFCLKLRYARITIPTRQAAVAIPIRIISKLCRSDGLSWIYGRNSDAMTYKMQKIGPHRLINSNFMTILPNLDSRAALFYRFSPLAAISSLYQ